jgi:GDP-L-fucose synthase
MYNVGVLGSTGFVGTNLTKKLSIYGIKNFGGSRRTGVDATNIGSLTNWIQNNNITHLVNLAAECGGIGLNQRIPANLWRSTTMISNSVLEAARLTEIKKIIMVGTTCSYPQNCPIPFKEEYLMQYGFPEDTNMAYGVAKLNAMVGAQAYAKQYKMNICNILPANMYGPNDHFDLDDSHVIPAMIRKFADAINNKHETITLWGTGSATREFLHVDDFAVAIILALNCLNTPEFINVGTGREISIIDLAYKISKLVGFKGEIHWDTSKPDGQPKRCLDISKAKRLFGFESSIELDEGLSNTINWFKSKGSK